MTFEKQTLGDLNGYLFEQLERLNDPELSEDELSRELQRTKAVVSVSNQVVNVGKLVLDAQKFYDDRNDYNAAKPKMLTAGDVEED